jgi:hypothetical protein
MPRHDNIAFYHPYSSWCAKEDVADKFFQVRFVEKKVIVGVMSLQDPLENKWVSKASIQYTDADGNWVYALAEHNKNVSIFFVSLVIRKTITKPCQCLYTEQRAKRMNLTELHCLL